MDISINSHNLKRFLGLVSLSGEHQTKEALFNVKTDSITTLIKSPTNAIGVCGKLFGKFSDLGELGIDDLALFMNSVKIITQDVVKLDVKENKVILRANKSKTTLMLRKADYIKNIVSEPAFKKHSASASECDGFTIAKEVIPQINQTYGLIKSPTVIIKGKGKTITFIFEKNENQSEIDIPIVTEVQEFSTKLDAFFISLLVSIDDNVKLYMKQGVPAILVDYTNPDMSIQYIVAPMVNK